MTKINFPAVAKWLRSAAMAKLKGDLQSWAADMDMAAMFAEDWEATI